MKRKKTKQIIPKSSPAIITFIEQKHKLIIIALAIILFLLLLILPKFGGLDYRYLGKSTKIAYGLMFKYFLEGGTLVDLFLETPKPLVALIYYLLTPTLIYLFLSILITFSFICFVRMIKIINSFYLAGILAFLYTMFLFEDAFGNIFSCYWIWLFVSIQIIAFYYFFAKDYVRYCIFITLAGLIRPESWAVAFIVLGFAIYQKLPRKYLFIIPLVAPLLWFGFDAKTFGNPLFSYAITAKYRVITGIPGVTFSKYLPSVIRDIKAMTGSWFLIIGFISALATILFRFREKSNQDNKILKTNYWLLFIFTFVPLVFYLLLSLRGEVIPMRRFFLLMLMFMAFYIFNIPNLLFNTQKNKIIVMFIILGVFLWLNKSSMRSQLSQAYLNNRNEEIKIKAVESSVPDLKYFSDSLTAIGKSPQWLITPLRRKILFAVDFPLYQRRLESFREIAALKKKLKPYAPSLIYYLKDDFAGVEYTFDFLKQKQVYPINQEGVVFIPLAEKGQYLIYLLDNI